MKLQTIFFIFLFLSHGAFCEAEETEETKETETPKLHEVAYCNSKEGQQRLFHEVSSKCSDSESGWSDSLKAVNNAALEEDSTAIAKDAAEKLGDNVIDNYEFQRKCNKVIDKCVSKCDSCSNILDAIEKQIKSQQSGSKDPKILCNILQFEDNTDEEDEPIADPFQTCFGKSKSQICSEIEGGEQETAEAAQQAIKNSLQLDEAITTKNDCNSYKKNASAARLQALSSAGLAIAAAAAYDKYKNDGEEKNSENLQTKQIKSPSPINLAGESGYGEASPSTQQQDIALPASSPLGSIELDSESNKVTTNAKSTNKEDEKSLASSFKGSSDSSLAGSSLNGGSGVSDGQSGELDTESPTNVTENKNNSYGVRTSSGKFSNASGYSSSGRGSNHRSSARRGLINTKQSKWSATGHLKTGAKRSLTSSSGKHQDIFQKMSHLIHSYCKEEDQHCQ